MTKKVRKAVIPCGGYGTRFLPVTKVLPKEFLPIVDTPTLQYIIEETANSGIEEVLIILSPQKDAIRKFFQSNRSLEQILLSGGKKEEYDIITRDFGVKVSFAVQEVMNGNGNAILLAEEFANNEPFAVLFGDDLMYTGEKPQVTKQLIDAYDKTGKTIVGVQQTPEKVARRCGVMKIKNTIGNLTEIDGIVENQNLNCQVHLFRLEDLCLLLKYLML